MAKKIAETEPETGTEIATFAPDNIPAIFAAPEKVDALIADITKIVDAFVPNTKTPKGRKEIAALAFKVTRTKTALDDAGFALNEERRKLNDVVNAKRRDIKEKLDALRDRARKPLDDWEKDEAERGAKIEQILASMDTAIIWPEECSSDYARSRLAEINALEFDADIFQEWLEIAVAKKMQTIIQIEAKISALVKAEADAAELAELRAEKDRRDEQDRLREIADAEKEAERIAEENRVRDAELAAQAERDAETERAAQHVEFIRAKIQHIRDIGRGLIGGEPYPLPILWHELRNKVDMTDDFGDLRNDADTAYLDAQASLDAMQELADERASADRAAEIAEAEKTAARIATENSDREKQKTIDAANAETRRLQDAEDARIAEENRIKAEQTAREKDKAHRGSVMKSAKEALMTVGTGDGLNEASARLIVLAIVAGEIPNVRMMF